MMEIGHSQTFRFKVTERVLKKYDDMLQLEEEGIKRVHRNKGKMLADKRKNKHIKSKSNWFRYKTNAEAIS